MNQQLFFPKDVQCQQNTSVPPLGQGKYNLFLRVLKQQLMNATLHSSNTKLLKVTKGLRN